MMQQSIKIRVRYPEVDRMGYLHHSRFFQYFEIGRVELLRSMGHSYAELEAQGVFFVVIKAQCHYKLPARYDEELDLETRIVRQTHVRIDHTYRVVRGEDFLATGETTIACVDGTGRLQQIPQELARARL